MLALNQTSLTRFHDRYEGEDTISKPASAPPTAPLTIIDAPVVANGTTSTAPPQPPVQFVDSRPITNYNPQPEPVSEPEPHVYGENIYGDDRVGSTNNHSYGSSHVTNEHGFTGTVGIKEDG